MSRNEIIEKLDSLFKNHLPFTEEYQAVYLLVEIRKILDRENNSNYPVLRFYSDWSVHTAKDRITPEMRQIMEEIYTDIFNEISNPEVLIGKQTKIIGFMYMEDLQAEMELFLQEYGLLNDWVKDKDNWLSLITLLVRVLVDQPINRPCADIEQFSFLPAAPGRVRGVVVFKDKIGKHDHFRFGNVY